MAMKKEYRKKWTETFSAFGVILLMVLFSPIILLFLLWDKVVAFFTLPRRKKEYHQSPFYKDLSVPYKRNLQHSPQYRVYNSLKERHLEFRFSYPQSYFVYENTVYLLGDFDQILSDENEGIWKADYDGDLRPLDRVYEAMAAEARSREETLPVKLLVERRVVSETDLRGMELPEYMTLIRSYDRVFEEEDPQLLLMVPTDEEELYDMMCRTPGLPGKFAFPQEGPLVWELYEDAELHIGVDPLDCCVSVHKKGSSKFRKELTHWHSDIFEIYDQVRDLGKPGNILAIRSSLFGKTTYIGNREGCPYHRSKGSLFRKLHIYEPKE